ncbi:MAG TPA: hypothetical protein VF316_19610 [Polyangiaceae bacterium]
MKLRSILWVPALLVPAALLGACKDKAPPPPAAEVAVVQVHMAATMKNLKGKGLESHEQDALAAFLTSMKGRPRSGAR